jgi:hypothetical protein
LITSLVRDAYTASMRPPPKSTLTVE